MNRTSEESAAEKTIVSPVSYRVFSAYWVNLAVIQSPQSHESSEILLNLDELPPIVSKAVVSKTMTRRMERIGNLIRNTIGELLLSKISDPRIDPARTSVTRVEVADDLLTAKVYISVIGTEAQQRTTLAALRHAAGHIQELMMRQIELRLTPVLNFTLDAQFKKALKTLEILQKVSQELREKDLQRSQEAPPDGPSDDQNRKDSE